MVKRAVGKVQRLIGLAANAPTPARARKRVAAAQRTLTGLRKKIDAAAQHGKITESCGATIDLDLATLQTVLDGLPI